MTLRIYPEVTDDFAISRAAWITLTLVLWSSASKAETPYYTGKTITNVAGTKAGDVYDLYARLYAQYMPKHIPGYPNNIVQYMPGAGSMFAAHYLHNVARQDGQTIGAIFPALYFDQIIVRPQVNFDWSNFVWIRSPMTSNQLLYMRADSPYKSIVDVVKASASDPP